MADVATLKIDKNIVKGFLSVQILELAKSMHVLYNFWTLLCSYVTTWGFVNSSVYSHGILSAVKVDYIRKTINW